MAIDFTRAYITIDLSRDSIDPEGLASDDQIDACCEHILDRVGAAFPGATICEGSRCSGVTRGGVTFDREVSIEVNRAYDSFSW